MTTVANEQGAATVAHTFADKVALIFGGAKGIGRSVACEWARRGARIAIADIDYEAAQDTARTIVDEGGVAIPLQTDVTDAGSVERTFQDAAQAIATPDIVMANVGAIVNGHPEDIPFDEWERIVDLNYWGTLRIVKHVLPRFLETGAGHIVTTASFAGLYPYAVSRMPYASAKAAVISLSEQMALYCEPKGIRVTCLIPGPVLTGVTDGMKNWTENCPMRGPGGELELKLPDEVAAVLANGMENGAILVPSDDRAWDILQRWAECPDAFIRQKIADFASGDIGQPQVPDHIRRMLAQSSGPQS